MITLHLFYTGTNGNAVKFAKEMESSGIADLIRQERGNLRYEYYCSFDDPETVLLIDSWSDQQAIDLHHTSVMMTEIARLREKYNLHMKAERFVSEEMGTDSQYLRK